MKDRAVVFVTDQGFLFPSIFCANQLTNYSTVTECADIIIITIDVPNLSALEKHFGTKGIHFLSLRKSDFWPEDKTFEQHNHVPIATLGRLAIQKVLPDNYKHITYLDGDTYILGDISPLIKYSVPTGKIASANDTFWLNTKEISPTFWESHAPYIHSLGLSSPNEYFNAGVLAFHIDTWRELAPKAMDYFLKNVDQLKYHDQSALNATFYGKRETLSPCWNFQTGYRELGVQTITPKICHFTGAMKPWTTKDSPWGSDIYQAYADFASKHPVLTPHITFKTYSISFPTKLKKLLKQLLKSGHRYKRKQLLEQYLRETEFNF